MSLFTYLLYPELSVGASLSIIAMVLFVLNGAPLVLWWARQQGIIGIPPMRPREKWRLKISHSVGLMCAPR